MNINTGKTKKSTLLKWKSVMRRFFSKHEYIPYLTVLFLFPLLLNIIFLLIPTSFFRIEEGEMLSFYGVAAGIFSSYITYRNAVRKEKEEKNSRLRPFIGLTAKKVLDDIVEIELTRYGDAVVRDVFLYDIPLTDILENKLRRRVSFRDDKKDGETLHMSLCGYDEDLIDQGDGLPKYITVSCCDRENRLWVLEYRKQTDGNGSIYMLAESFLG